MGRQRNEETIAQIRAAVWQSFLTTGYEKTTFSDIAKLTGLNRSIVQYYFPKKELFSTLVMAELADTVAQTVRKEWPAANRLVQHYYASQLYFEVVLQPVLQPLLLKLLTNRKLTTEAMYNQIIWSVDALTDQIDEAVLKARYLEVVEVWGGIAEVMYYSLAHQQTIHVQPYLPKLLSLIADIAGYDAAEVTQVMTDNVIPADVLGHLQQQVLQQLNLA